MKKVLVIGSANMDTTIYLDKFPTEGETTFANSKFVQPGGKGANQAVASARSGLSETKLICSVGNDSEGKLVLKTLKDSGVSLKTKLSSESTGIALIFVDKTSQNEIVIHAGANNDVLGNDFDGNDFDDVSVLLLQNEIPQETNEKAIKLAHKNGVKVIYNPAPYRKINPELYQFIDILNVNEVELEQYSGEDDIFKGAKKLIGLGLKKVLVTLGSQGSLIYDGNAFIKVDALKVKAIDTVAAGDTYIGYFSACLACGMSEFEAMKVATKASSITVTRKGSIASIPFGKEFLNK